MVKWNFLCLRWRCIAALLMCCIIFANQCHARTENILSSRPDPFQAAEILGVRSQVERLELLRKDPGADREEILLLRALILRKILRGSLEVRQYCNRLDLERAYTYDIMQKEARRQTFVGQIFTAANFAQLSTFYTLEPFMRMQDQFKTSAIFTTVSGSLNTSISTLSRVHSALAKANNVAPPAVLGNLVEGGPVDGSRMPPLLDSFFDAPLPNSGKTRRQEIYSFWLRQYGIDASDKENLCSLADKKKASLNLLRSRILLLWSLRTAVLQFDCDLLALLKKIGVSQEQISGSSSSSSASSATESELARSLRILPQMEEVRRLKQSGADFDRIIELEVLILERTLEGALEIQVATDKVDEELYYNYHIVLSDLASSRAKWLQLNYDANFLQSGILGIVAGKLYLSKHTFAGDQMFVISGSNGTALTLLAAMQMHGFWRKVDTGPNSLADILGLKAREDYRFSTFVSKLLNSPPPGSVDGKSRRELLNEEWRRSNLTTMDLDSPKTLQAVSAMPSHRYDTIKVVKNRIALLQSLKKELESFQAEALNVLVSTEQDR